MMYKKLVIGCISIMLFCTHIGTHNMNLTIIEGYEIFFSTFRYMEGYSIRTPKKHLISDSYRDVTALKEEARVKRGVLNLFNMISCATGCKPLSYKGYGCFCGFLGSGTPVDGIDKCCKFHDWCYVTAQCPMYLEYFVPYYWKCWNNKPICAFNHGHFGSPGSCAHRLCECDRALSECLKKFPCPSERPICRSSPLKLIQNALMIFS